MIYDPNKHVLIDRYKITKSFYTYESLLFSQKGTPMECVWYQSK